MPSAVVMDFETYFDPKQKYSLRNMSNEGYILDRRFQVHGCTVIDAEAGVRAFLDLPAFKDYLRSKDWRRNAVLSHNARFDMAILCWVFHIIPAAYIDTLSIANQFILPYAGRVSLDKCCEHLGRQGKPPNFLRQCEGLRTEHIKGVPGLWNALCQYAVADGDNAWAIYKEYWWKMKLRERMIMDWTIRNYVRGRLRLDIGILQENLYKEEKERKDLLAELGLADATSLRSTKQFADKLLALGVDVEYKSNTKGTELIPAFAKDDTFMRERAGHPDPKVRLAIKGRLAFQSNIEITRTTRLIAMAQTTGGKMLVPLNFHAAHTGRFGGTEGINVQNFKKKSLLRQAIKAPPGMALVSVDASQIEARLVGWLAGCKGTTDAFAAGRDLYSEFASIAFGYPVYKAEHPTERQVGKVSILQLGYQSGADKLRKKLEGSGIVVSMEEAREYVGTYRQTYREIPAMWWSAEMALRQCAISGLSREFILPNLIFTKEGILLPSGRWIYYPQLKIDKETDQIVYWAAKYKVWKQLYGGSITENIIQSIARDVVTEVHVTYINDVVMQGHDELVQLVPEEIAWERYDATKAAMSVAPDWLVHPKLGKPPLSAEGYAAYCYANPD